jgi:phospholipid transport system transporter-binding protein
MFDSFQIAINAKQDLAVSGRIDLTNVVQACATGKNLIDTLNTVRVDLSGLEHADSSSLAMLVDWIRSAKVQHKNIVLYNLPPFLLDLGRVCGLDSILPINKPLEFHN